VLLIDAIVVEIRDGQVANRPVYVAMGVNLDGERGVLGMWVGPSGGEGAKFWMSVLTELPQPGVSPTRSSCAATASKACPTLTMTITSGYTKDWTVPYMRRGVGAAYSA